MTRSDIKVEKVYLYPKPVNFRNPSTASRPWSNWISKLSCSTESDPPPTHSPPSFLYPDAVLIIYFLRTAGGVVEQHDF